MKPFGNTALHLPQIIFGTSCLGNLYEVVPDDTKLALVSEILRHSQEPIVLDCAGKYGAGLALETIGRTLEILGVPPGKVLISNKLGWYRVPLRGPEPTFERGVWAGIHHDAESRISRQGILDCHYQGCELLGGVYRPRLVSVHDPDEYLAAATSSLDRARRFDDVLDAYGALFELKASGEVAAVGIGSKDWRVIREISERVKLDWVMFACSLTVYSHPPKLLDFIASLRARGVGIINSAVFNAGFLTGGKWFDYRIPTPASDPELFAWREKFMATCGRHGVVPADACVQFGLAMPGISAIALNTGKPDRIRENVGSATKSIPATFWADLKEQALISASIPLEAFT